MSRGTVDPKKLSFEEAFARLEEVVRALEAGDVKLEESLRLFEEGVALARACSSKLDAAEGKMRKLLETGDGEVREQPLDDVSGEAS